MSKNAPTRKGKTMTTPALTKTESDELVEAKRQMLAACCQIDKIRGVGPGPFPSGTNRDICAARFDSILDAVSLASAAANRIHMVGHTYLPMVVGNPR